MMRGWLVVLKLGPAVCDQPPLTSLCVQAPSARNVLVPGTCSATVGTRPAPAIDEERPTPHQAIAIGTTPKLSLN